MYGLQMLTRRNGIVGWCFAIGVYIRHVQATETTDGWTDAETLLLLEAVALYGEKWQAVGAYVGSKNQLQCVTRFLALPIDEALVDGLERPDLQPTRMLPPPNASSFARNGAHLHHYLDPGLAMRRKAPSILVVANFYHKQ
jgi:hypothetical protein